MSVSDADILRVVASMLWTDGNVAQNVFNCLVSGGGGPYDDTDVTDDMEDWLDDMFANITTSISDELDGNEVLVYKYDPGDDDWDEVSSQSWSWNPSGAGDQEPRGVAALIRLWTTDPDVQGKKYIAGTTEGSVQDGLFSSGWLVPALAFAADWFLPFVGSASGATFTPGIWSVVQTAFVAAVDHIAATAIPAYQRRRKRNVGI
jgi:hypothetical protein